MTERAEGEREPKVTAMLEGRIAAGDFPSAVYLVAARVVYSDLGFITLGLLLQRATDAPLAGLAREHVFAPLGLARTFFNPEKSLQTGVAACESGGNAYERGMCEGERGPRPESDRRT